MPPRRQIHDLQKASLMIAHEIRQIVCLRCLTELDVGDEFCRRCGAQTSRPAAETSPQSPGIAAPPEPAPAAPRATPGVAESRALVLLLLFAVLGPLALPVLWRSPRFSRPWKMLLTILVLIFTVVIVGALWYAVTLFLGSLKELKDAGVFD